MAMSEEDVAEIRRSGERLPEGWEGEPEFVGVEAGLWDPVYSGGVVVAGSQETAS